MNAILKRLRQLDDEELLALSEAIDVELERRLERLDAIPESARRRAVQRQRSYRRELGSAAPPISVCGLGKGRKRRLAA